MIELSSFRFNAGRRARSCLAFSTAAPACPSRNLSPGPSRRPGGELILRGVAGAEGKDDRAP
jgi:hypothetical protein